jgi:hypothetical protein
MKFHINRLTNNSKRDLTLLLMIPNSRESDLRVARAILTLGLTITTNSTRKECLIDLLSRKEALYRQVIKEKSLSLNSKTLSLYQARVF